MSSEQQFIRAAGEVQSRWTAASADFLSGVQVPDRVLGDRRRSLLRSDAAIQWANWFVESAADPRRYSASDKTYAHVFSDVFTSIRGCFVHLTSAELSELASEIAGQVWASAQVYRSIRSRVKISKADRYEMLGKCAGDPRCWMCGHRFGAEAIDRFLGEQEVVDRPSLPLFVDVFKPAGLSFRDRVIEVDHVLAWSLGGGEQGNLRLACGWCNSVKSSNRGIYDVSGAVVAAGPNMLGITSLPQKYWVVRLIASVGRCEHPGGCSKNIDTDELTVEPILKFGSPTPNNLRVVCPHHHYLGPDRLLPRAEVGALWACR